MGSSATRPLKLSPLNLQDYEQLITECNDTYQSLPNRRLIKNKFTNLQLQQYNLEFANENQMNQYYEVFYWRMTQQYIARTLHFCITKQPECCSPMCRAKVYTERVFIRLSDIKDIPYPDNLYMILATADAFDKIVQKIGFFDIQENMIGINSKGEIRVWINEDLSSNTIDVETYQCKTEKQMAKRLVKMINQNTQNESEPTNFERYVNSRCSNLSFYDLMVLVKQYAKIYKTNIPTNFNSAIEAVKGNPSFTSRTMREEQSVSRFSDRSGLKKFRNRQVIKPKYQYQVQNHISDNMKYIPSYTKLTNNYDVGNPSFNRIPSFHNPVEQPKASSNSFQRKYLQNPTISPKITEPRRMITRVQMHTPPSIYKLVPMATTPLSAYASPLQNRQFETQGVNKFTQKTYHTNNFSGKSTNSFRFLRTDRRTNDHSAQKIPSNYKVPSKYRQYQVFTSPFQQREPLKQYYSKHPQIVQMERIPSVEMKLQQYFETASIHDNNEMKSYKNKTTHGRQSFKQISAYKKHKGSFDRKMLLKDKYEMDPQISRDLARFYQNH